MTTYHHARIAPLAILTAMFVVLSATSVLAQSSPVQLVPGNQIIFSLTEDPTTGYVWHFDPQGSTNASIVNVTDLGFARPPSAQPLAGAPGVHRWSIKGVRTGRASVHFISSRPWEATPARQQSVVVEVR